MAILAVRHVPSEGMGLLEKVFEESGVAFEYLNAQDKPFPSVDLARYAGLVVMGGPMGVYETDRFPFLAREMELLRDALRRGMPTLGICLGSQLLAAAAGAKVFRGQRKEIGWFPVRMQPEASNDPLLKPLPSEATVFHWHGDTFELPKGAVHLASSDRYAHQAFRIGERAWGFQFHLEMTEPMIREWVDEADAHSKTAHPDWNACEALTQTPCFLPEMETLARRVFGAFASLASRSTAR